MYWYLGGDTGTVSEMESMLQQEEAHVDAGEACLQQYASFQRSTRL